ncbi:MAG: UrcA family protein [Pseudomonadota bacterium]
MPHTFSVMAAAVLGTTAMVSGSNAVAQAADTFSIELIANELESSQGRRAFNERLHDEAQNYCSSHAPYASTSDLRRCESAIIEAVLENLAARDNAASGRFAASSDR